MSARDFRLSCQLGAQSAAGTLLVSDGLSSMSQAFGRQGLMPIITQCACALGAGRSSRPVSTIHERTPPQNVYAKCSVWKLYKGTLGWIPSRAWDDLPLIESVPRVCVPNGARLNSLI